MEKWSFGYALLKIVAWLAFRLSHRKITVIGKENIPYGKPIIFAPNHQNALMDPLAVLFTTKGQQVWLARADIFHSPLSRSILKFLKILPIYRIRDGKDLIEKNDTIFATAIKVLEKKKIIGLFPEAGHSARRRMLPHKKAVSRIAFMAESKNNFQLNLKVIPVGIYYDHYWHFGRSILVNYGEPISLSDYQSQYEENGYKASLQLKDDIVNELKKRILDIPSDKHYENYELLRKILGKQFSRANCYSKSPSVNRFYSDKKLMELLQKKEAENQKEFKELHKKLDEYREQLEKLHLNDELFNLKNIELKLIINLTLSILFAPLLLAGTLLFAVPFLIPRSIIQKKVTDPSFLSTFHFVAGLIIHPIYVVAVAIVVLTITKSLLLSLLSIPMLFVIGKLAFGVYQLWRKSIQMIRFIYAKNIAKTTFKQTSDIRKSCISISDGFIRDFF